MKSGNINMHYGASKLLFQRAEILRKSPTREEDLMWTFLKGNQFGVKFRRQHPLLFYIADFYCHELKLVIEIDGGIHIKADVKINDEVRQREIENLGIKVIRFTNDEVIKAPENILMSISNKIKDIQSSMPQSSPLGAGGQSSRFKAIIFSAGLGTRFKPWTDTHPKALAVVNGKTILQRNIEYLQQYEIKDVVVNVHHFPEQIIEAIQKNKGWGSNIYISDESDQVLETGGGLLKAKDLLNNDTFLTINVDILTEINLKYFLAKHQQENSLITLAIAERKTSRYLLFNKYNRLVGWRNTKTGEEKIAIKAK